MYNCDDPGSYATLYAHGRAGVFGKRWALGMAALDVKQAMDRPDAKRFKVGLLADPSQLTGWRLIAAQRLLNDEMIDVVLVITSKADGSRSGPLRQRVAASLWRIADQIDASIARRFMHGLLARINSYDEKLLDRQHRSGDRSTALARIARVESSDHRSIESADLDVVVDLCEDSRADAETPPSRFGTLEVACGRSTGGLKPPLGFWAFYRNEPIAAIHVLAGGAGHAGRRTIATARYCTYRWSWTVNETLLGLKASWVLVDTIRRLDCQADRRKSFSVVDVVEDERRAAVRAPALLFKSAWRTSKEALNRLCCEDRWRVLVAAASSDGRAKDAPAIIEPPAGRYWADPFSIRQATKLYLFFEEYRYAERRGVISYADISGFKPGQSLAPGSSVVIDAPYHLSYPFLFTHEGGNYMIPESSANKTIDLWRAARFPDCWVKHKTIMRGISATDTSLLEWGGRYWLFTNLDRNGMNDHRSELHIFHAKDPVKGPWEPHALNPVLVDARVARMAGGFLRSADGQPIRCGQVQGRRYGEAVAYRLVTELSESRYREDELEGFAPIAISPGARTHHVSVRDGLIVADECQAAWKARRLGIRTRARSHD